MSKKMKKQNYKAYREGFIAGIQALLAAVYWEHPEVISDIMDGLQADSFVLHNKYEDIMFYEEIPARKILKKQLKRLEKNTK